MLRSKIHLCTVTECRLDYEGSLGIDKKILDAADMIEFEKVLVANVNTGERFETYIIELPENCGTVCLNGPAARYGMVGDRLVVFSFCQTVPDKDYKPRIVICDQKNQITQKR